MTRLRFLIVTLAFTFTLVPAAHGAVTFESFSAEAASNVAGAHSDANTTFDLRAIFTAGEGPLPFGGDPDEVIVKLPPGVVGNPQNTPLCPRSLFTNFSNGCPASTQIGVAHVKAAFVERLHTFVWGVYNVQPGPDEPALIGIQGVESAIQTTIPIDLKASASDNYAITATAAEIPQVPVKAHTLGASVTLWGVPAAHLRGAGSSTNVEAAPAESLAPSSPSAQKPFMENPTDCSQPPITTLAINTFQEMDVFTTAVAQSAIPTECASVPFTPSIEAKPDTVEAGAPAGLEFELTVPQSNTPAGRGSAELEKAVLTLPQGMTISPTAASRPLEGCTDEQFAVGSDAPANCPAASSIGEDVVETPLLPGSLRGEVYLGQPLSTEPQSGTMFRIFQELKGFGLDIKLQGSVVADRQTGQLTATFSDLPELPFENYRLHLRGGPNAVLVNPPTCGSHMVTSKLYPYSNPSAPATPSSSFQTSYDGKGASCPSTLPFSPSSSISTANSLAGALSPLTVSFSRSDGMQPLGQIDAQLPAGLLAYVSKVALCESSAALAGTCLPESRIGTVTTTAGAGEDPLTVGGSVYLARGSDGYPFMLSVVVPAVAGPYDLGNVTVPVLLQVNNDGSLTAHSGSLPSILDGIPLDIRSVTLTIDRPGFAVNPTNCDPLALTGTASALSGVIAPLSAPFEVSGCDGLHFAPSFNVATQGSTSKVNGASLTVRVSQKPGEADIHSVHVEVPKSLPARLSTLNKACTEQQFASSPAGCPPGSVVGTATAYTPLLPVAVSGPAILVSHAAAAFPDLDIILQGDGVTVDLVGNTEIRKGVTRSTFASVPDVPISGFELNLPEGPYSIFAANGKLCKQKLVMPTTIAGQNGITVTQSTRIAVSGCPRPKPTIQVTKAKATAGRILVTVRTSVRGTVRLTGHGVIARTVKSMNVGSHVMVLSLANHKTGTLALGKTLGLHMTLTVGKVSVAKAAHVRV